jgi:putative FmdB family regulatory protein
VSPAYDYEHKDATSCELGHRFETFQKITSEPLTVCNKCGTPINRIISGGSGFILNGGGWYKDSYSSPKQVEKSTPIPEVKPSDFKPSDPSKSKEPKTYKKEEKKE